MIDMHGYQSIGLICFIQYSPRENNIKIGGMMLRKIGFLTQEQFDTAIERSRLSLKGRAAALRVLVGKESQAAVAKEINVSREKVRQYCYAVYRRHITLTASPDGWISTTVCLPKNALKDVQTMEKRLRMEYEKDKNKK